MTSEEIKKKNHLMVSRKGHHFLLPCSLYLKLVTGLLDYILYLVCKWKDNSNNNDCKIINLLFPLIRVQGVHQTKYDQILLILMKTFEKSQVKVRKQTPLALSNQYEKEAFMAQWLCHSPCKPEVAGSIAEISSPSDETLTGPISICP